MVSCRPALTDGGAAGIDWAVCCFAATAISLGLDADAAAMRILTGSSARAASTGPGLHATPDIILGLLTSGAAASAAGVTPAADAPAAVAGDAAWAIFEAAAATAAAVAAAAGEDASTAAAGRGESSAAAAAGICSAVAVSGSESG